MNNMKNDPFNEFKQNYTKAFPEKFAAMARDIEQLRHNVSLETLQELRLYVHKMAGTAGMYGYPAISDICLMWDKKLSELLKSFPACQKDLSWLDDSALWLEKLRDCLKPLQSGA